jgi:alkanesulfonate monooxygenase SsuD/methylene tetrahydromethanopterin reductase-like flavin-dependent oxidoreductase (luciferase family)
MGVKVGIGLPITIPGAQPEQVLEWARRAERAGFSTLGTLDRLVYPNYEPLVALGAVAAVTEQIGLMTAVLLLPIRQNAAVVAKQAVTLQRLSGGRFTLGVGLGSREDDYSASGLSTKGRGRSFEEMLAQIRRLFDGEEVGYAGGVGPDVSDNPPQLIIGGTVDAAFRRAARYGDGWMLGGGAPDRFPALVEKLLAAWREHGRDGEPRKLALQYFAMGADPEGDTRASIGHYYASAGDYAEQVVAATAKGPDQVRERIRQFEDAGADELILFPASPDPDEVDRLADAVL